MTKNYVTNGMLLVRLRNAESAKARAEAANVKPRPKLKPRASGGRASLMNDADVGINDWQSAPAFDPSKPYEKLPPGFAVDKGPNDWTSAPAFDPSKPYTTLPPGYKIDGPTFDDLIPQDTPWTIAKQTALGVGRGILGLAGNLGEAVTARPGREMQAAARAADAVQPQGANQHPEGPTDSDLRRQAYNQALTPGYGDQLRAAAGLEGVNAPPTTAQRIASGFGEGASGAILGGPFRGVANAVVGGIGGMTGRAASESAPDDYKPAAEIAGNILGGVGAGVVGGGLRGAMNTASRFTQPFTKEGQQVLAGRTLERNATDPAAARAALDNPQEIVPGSNPTTFQQTGDMGLGALERRVATENPAEFQQRRFEQNNARRDLLENLETKGSPADVSGALRRELSAIDGMTQDATAASAARAQDAVQSLGGQLKPEEYGATVRTALSDALTEAKTKERALWNAVDPDNSLALQVTPLKSVALRLSRAIPSTAKPLGGEEADIFGTIKDMPTITPFNDLTALRSRISTEMRNEMRSGGNTPTYARLSQLRGAIEASIGAAIAKKNSVEQLAVQQGRLAPEDTLFNRLTSTSEAAPSAPNVGVSIFTPSGRQVGVSYGLEDARNLVTSHTPDLQPNPAFPAELQPRDRSRIASDFQIANMSKNLQPERLGPSPSASEGAPVIGPGNLVESGNARVLAIRRALQEGGPSGQAYRQYLQAQGFEIPPGMAEPVLVRRRVTDLTPQERVRFTEEANAPSGLAMSATERAATDAQRVPPHVLDLYQGGDLSSPANRDFVRGFVRSVAEPGQEGALATATGALSREGEQRIQNALLHSAYEDPNLVGRLAEVGDENIRGFGGAMWDAAGDMARLRNDIKAGAVSPGVDLTPDLLSAVRLVGEARAKQVPLASVVGQRDAFSQVSSATDLLLRGAYGPNLTERLSRGQFSDMLRAYAKEASQQSTEARLFGEPLTAAQILERVEPAYGRRAFNSGEGNGTPSPAERGPGAAPRGPAGNEAEPGSIGILDKPELRSNFDKAAAERLAAATAATKERARTFGQGPVSQVLRTQGERGNYRVPDPTVAGRFFKPGVGGYDAVKQFRRAAGDEQALGVLQDYAVSDMRRTALRPDGTIDPAKFERWQSKYSEALRAFPDLRARFGDALAAEQSMASVAAIRKDALALYQKGIVGDLLGARSPDEVIKSVGGLFGSKTGPRDMRRLVAATRNDPDARAGLRKAVVDHMLDKFSSTAEAGTTGRAMLNADGLQKFISGNQGTLGMGFNPSEMKSMSALAADMQRANRSVTALKLPGGSNTPQDLAAMSNLQTVMSLARHAVPHSMGLGVAGFLGSKVASMMRGAGIRSADDLVRDAMLNPDLARTLLMKVSKIPNNGSALSVASALSRVSTLRPLAIGSSSINGRRKEAE